MAESVVKSYFPSQAVSDLEKISYEYGLKVGKAIQKEWFDTSYNHNKYLSARSEFHRRRLYARGEQSIQKYKDELSINGDLSYLNLDWKPVPIIPKFVDIVVNGIAERTYDIKAYAQDPYGVSKRTEYMESVLRDMQTKDLADFAQKNLGVDITENQGKDLPETEEELALHMQLTYKQAVEIAEEQALNMLLEGNNYELIKKRFFYDLTVLGIGAVKTNFNTSEGAKVEYVDPANLVYSYSESPYFEDLYYVGEVKEVPVNELVKEFPHLNQEEIEDIVKESNINHGRYNRTYSASRREQDINKIQVLYFNYKTYMNEVYKVKTMSTGGEKAIEKDDSFNPPEGKQGDYERLLRSVEVLYDGALILGTDKLIKWQMCKNMIRPKSDYTKVKMNYSIVAPRMYNGSIESLVSRITGFADMIQLTHLKLQQEALNMFFQTGSVIGRSMNELGEGNPARVPIQEIASGSGGNKMQALITNYNYYLQMIRDVTGLNEARDGSTPDRQALVGVQKLAAANSNTATRHILQAGLYLTAETAEKLSLRISDIIEYSPTKNAFIQSLGAHNVATLSEMSELHLYDFGILIDLSPDEEEKQMLENNIQVALANKLIDLEDAIDIRTIQNVKLANQVLKVRRKKKAKRDQLMQQQNIQAQASANAQAAQAAAQAETQKQQALTASQLELEQGKVELKIQYMAAEAEMKKKMAEHQYTMDYSLKKLEIQGLTDREAAREDRKDERTKIQATQQSEMIDQRQKNKPPKNFQETSDGNMSEFDLFNV